ncbi:MAG: hypothetical protein IPK26_08305 [Planctomycetes bacterium]|nr:hypothetical protein [Planctomycetota bacterium]
MWARTLLVAFLGWLLPAQRTVIPEAKPPMPAPRLIADDPVEVAWAAWASGKEAPVAATARQLRWALTRWRGERGEARDYAVLQILHALNLHEAVLPLAELEFRADGLAYMPWLQLLKRCREPAALDRLFDEWEPLTPKASPLWSWIGGHLVTARHPPTCQRVLDMLTPRLIVELDVSRSQWLGDATPMTCHGGRLAVAGQPPLPIGWWAGASSPIWQNSGFVAGDPLPDIRSVMVVRTAVEWTQLCWLAYLADRPELTKLAAPMVIDRDVRDQKDERIAERKKALEAALADAAAAVGRQGLSAPVARWRLRDENIEIISRR